VALLLHEHRHAIGARTFALSAASHGEAAENEKTNVRRTAAHMRSLKGSDYHWCGYVIDEPLPDSVSDPIKVCQFPT